MSDWYDIQWKLKQSTKEPTSTSQGPPGPQGEQGIQGIQGETGPKGDQGIPGTNGTNGSSTASGQSVADVANHFTATNTEDVLAELFTSVDDGKGLLETAIISKGGIVSKAGSIATFDELNLGIASISSIGYATGTATPVNKVLTVTGLLFRPKKIAVQMIGGLRVIKLPYIEGWDVQGTSAYNNGSPTRLIVTCTTNSSGFTISTTDSTFTASSTWQAYDT